MSGPSDPAAAEHATEVTDAVRAAALFAVLLELQGREEASITRVLERVADDGKQEIATPEAARKWLTTLVQRFDAAVEAVS